MQPNLTEKKSQSLWSPKFGGHIWGTISFSQNEGYVYRMSSIIFGPQNHCKLIQSISNQFYYRFIKFLIARGSKSKRYLKTIGYFSPENSSCSPHNSLVYSFLYLILLIFWIPNSVEILEHKLGARYRIHAWRNHRTYIGTFFVDHSIPYLQQQELYYWSFWVISGHIRSLGDDSLGIFDWIVNEKIILPWIKIWVLIRLTGKGKGFIASNQC